MRYHVSLETNVVMQYIELSHNPRPQKMFILISCLCYWQVFPGVSVIIQYTSRCPDLENNRLYGRKEKNGL